MDYDNIDFCLNMIYSYLNNKKDIVLEHINRKQITLEHIKKPESFDYTDIMKDLTYDGKYNNKHHYIKNRCRLIVGEYTNPLILDNGMVISYILSEIALNDKNPHICLPVFNFNIKNKIPKEVEKTKNTNYVSIVENYVETSVLSKFIELNKMTDIHWLVIIFQIFYALYKITEVYPNFRHNNLVFESVFICKYTGSEKYLYYTIDKKQYKIPNIGIICKLYNFDNSTIDETETYKFNPFYDIHSLLLSIYLYKELDSETKLFIESVIPEEHRYSSFLFLNEISLSLDIKTCKKLLENPFFTKYLNIDQSGGGHTYDESPTEFSENDNSSRMLVKYII